MPSKVDKIRIAGTQFDRRRKLTEEQKQEIVWRYMHGDGSWSSLAREYGVSKKTIGLLVNIDVKQKSDLRIKQHWKDYYDKDRASWYARDLRRYKKELKKLKKI